MLSRGQYVGGLYDIGFDKPETHVIRKGNTLYYAFFAPHFAGPVTLRGLPPVSTASSTTFTTSRWEVSRDRKEELKVQFEKSLSWRQAAWSDSRGDPTQQSNVPELSEARTEETGRTLQDVSPRGKIGAPMPKVTVQIDPSVCILAANCVEIEPSCFRSARNPMSN